jgi:hypothetical protein
MDKKLEDMSDGELAHQGIFSAEDLVKDKPRAVLIQQEWERRKMLFQHRLNRRLTILSGSIGFIGGILGTILGFSLSQMTQQPQTASKTVEVQSHIATNSLSASPSQIHHIDVISSNGPPNNHTTTVSSVHGVPWPTH